MNNVFALSPLPFPLCLFQTPKDFFPPFWEKTAFEQDVSKPLTGSRVQAKKQIEENPKSCAFWECVRYEPNTDGEGIFYWFKARQEYNDSNTAKRDLVEKRIEEKRLEIWPAVELSAKDVINLLDPKSRFPSVIHNHLEIFSELGFKIEQKGNEVYLRLPDREALLSRWAKLRKKHPKLPELKVQSSQGVAGHLEFVNAYFRCDVLLSSGKEFIHDHLIHVLPTLGFILSSLTAYQETKEYVIRHLKPVYEYAITARKLCNDPSLQSKIDFNPISLDLLKTYLPAIEMTLGSWTDLSAAQHRSSDTENLIELFNTDFFRYWQEKSWENYFSTQLNRTFDDNDMKNMSDVCNWLKKNHSKILNTQQISAAASPILT